jgi:hypothetical protein
LLGIGHAPGVADMARRVAGWPFATPRRTAVERHSRPRRPTACPGSRAGPSGVVVGKCLRTWTLRKPWMTCSPRRTISNRFRSCSGWIQPIDGASSGHERGARSRSSQVVRPGTSTTTAPAPLAQGASRFSIPPLRNTRTRTPGMRLGSVLWSPCAGIAAHRRE